MWARGSAVPQAPAGARIQCPPGTAGRGAGRSRPAAPGPGRPRALPGRGQHGGLAAYARAGGHLVLGPRTAYADHEGRARHEPAPGRLVDAAGVRYDEFSNLGGDVPLKPVPGSPLELPPGAAATRWVDGLTVLDAHVLAEYDHSHFGRWPAVTTRAPRVMAASPASARSRTPRSAGRWPAGWCRCRPTRGRTSRSP
ncbi:beta-galactosidase trimerization domain-containing protein [Amycolatopsis sp.]|uniref:beta-galactosidase trimerization domain-containing protein n=1 Tax=Amycolatopsis sp. TaxID=37632 RepID=UPI0039C86F74